MHTHCFSSQEMGGNCPGLATTVGQPREEGSTCLFLGSPGRDISFTVTLWLQIKVRISSTVVTVHIYRSFVAGAHTGTEMADKDVLYVSNHFSEARKTRRGIPDFIWKHLETAYIASPHVLLTYMVNA